MSGDAVYFYFGTPDSDRVKRFFGKLLGGEFGKPQPTDGGHFSDCRDDQGFEFGIWAPDP